MGQPSSHRLFVQLQPIGKGENRYEKGDENMRQLMNNLPVIGITMGDPAGIGPEVTMKAMSHERLHQICRPVVIGDAGMLMRVMKLPGIPSMKLRRIADVSEAVWEEGCLNVLDMHCIRDPENFQMGIVSREAGDAGFRYVEKVIGLALEGKVDATVTNAINKESMNLAGHHYSGHTEIYAELTGTREYTMLLAHENMRVVHVSTHVSLREACDLVKKDRILKVIRIAHEACVNLGITAPRIAVAGLNPHCGENGLFGTEEAQEIVPAVEEAVMEGMAVQGPVPPDTVFSGCRGGMYDIVVAMYHDQGHIPLKMTGFHYNEEAQAWDCVAGVNVTLGLPVIRTSVDHGTAFDQAGTGRANEMSLVNAIEYAVQCVNGKK